MLKLICGTLLPTSGQVTVNGSIGALLELGAGFNPEFSGKENARLYAALQGVPSSGLDDKVAEIEEFAEVGEYFDRPMKLYSSGMFVRVAFAASILASPDILIVDEALSVGDVYFQMKCEKEIRSFMDLGGTFILVAHSTNTIINMCDSAVVLDGGKLIYDGGTKTAIDTYLQRAFGSKPKAVKITKTLILCYRHKTTIII